MYQLHAFNARGEQLHDYSMLGGGYSVRFAISDDYGVITWSMGATAGIRSGYVEHGGWVRNRIAYFKILDGPYLLARADRVTVNGRTGIDIRPVVGTGESAREGDGRYSIESVNGGGCAAFFNGALIGAAAVARDAYAMAREHYAQRHLSPDQAASEAYRAMMGDPFGPADPHMPQGEPQSDAAAHSEVPAGNAAPAPAPAVTDDFTPNPYWGDVDTRVVKVSNGVTAGCAVYRASDGTQVDFVEWEDGLSLYAAGYRPETCANGGTGIIVTDNEWRKLADAMQWPATSEKFSNGLAERLHDSDFPDDTMGDTDGFGHYSLFRAECAVLATDSLGFVTVDQYGTEAAAQFAWDALTARYERFCLAGLEDALPTSDCEEIFLIFDTARHVNATPDRDEIGEHVQQCRICLPYRSALDEF